MNKRIAIQGYQGSFHQEAAEHYFNEPVEVVPARSFHDMMEIAADEEHSDLAVMAIENSIAGSILPNYSLLLDSDMHVVGEIYIRIQQNLLVNKGVKISDLKEVHSHPMAIHQCRKFFGAYPEIQLVETEDTALSAKKVAEEGSRTTGAIASTIAEELYGLENLVPSIETVKNNYTRFLVLSRESNAFELNGFNKASIHFKVDHSPGSLMEALVIISESGLNLSKIQSFPVIEEEWNYYFHVDVEFSEKQDLANALDGLKEVTSMLNTLGIYKKGDTKL